MKNVQQAFPIFTGKTALLRANFDVPIENGQIQDTTRIEDAVETIKFLRANQCKVVIMAHAGRPEGRFDAESTLLPVSTLLTKLLNEPVVMANYCVDYHQLVVPDAPLVLLDNVRFWAEEETNDPSFAATLASLGDFYVNEAFANCHRKHASIVGIPAIIPGFSGLSLSKEIDILSTVRNNPEHPLVVVIGGAKLETKAPLVEAFSTKADKILVGGKIAIEIKDKAVPANVVVSNLTPDSKDITESSASEFANIIMNAKTVIWNGTMGVFEEPEHQLGTKIVAEAINATPAFTLVGGGDTETALTFFNLESGINHISSGGGAMLTYLVDGMLVGVEALNGN
jgi:phosphoglycerate kinase